MVCIYNLYILARSMRIMDADDTRDEGVPMCWSVTHKIFLYGCPLSSKSTPLRNRADGLACPGAMPVRLYRLYSCHHCIYMFCTESCSQSFSRLWRALTLCCIMAFPWMPISMDPGSCMKKQGAYIGQAVSIHAQSKWHGHPSLSSFNTVLNDLSVI